MPITSTSAVVDLDAAAEPLRPSSPSHLAAEGSWPDPGVAACGRDRAPAPVRARLLPVLGPGGRQRACRCGSRSQRRSTRPAGCRDLPRPHVDHPVRRRRTRLGLRPSGSAARPPVVLHAPLPGPADVGRRRPAQRPHILEIGTGTGYSTALAARRSATTPTSPPSRSTRTGSSKAARTLYGLRLRPRLATADGLYGYWPHAPYDRIVAACSVRSIPATWMAQTRPGGKILTTLCGWMHGSGGSC